MNSVAWASTQDPPSSHAGHQSPLDHGADLRGLDTNATTLHARLNPDDGRSLLGSSSADGGADPTTMSADAAPVRPVSAEPVRRVEVTSLLSEISR